MEIAAFSISVLSFLVAAGALVWNELRWRAERRTDVRVLAWHDGMGVDIYAADALDVEHVIAVRVFNRGEHTEHVMRIGLESPSGEPLADDRPRAAKIVDELPPEARELPPRGQIAAQFRLSTEEIASGFVGYAALGTGRRAYSLPSMPEPGLDDIRSQIIGAISEDQADDKSSDAEQP